MKVDLDAEAKYAAEEDPWRIGAADSARYDLYVELIRARAGGRGRVLDVGCGFGAMLARLREDFDELNGVELSSAAVAKGRQRHPFIRFEQGSIDALSLTAFDRERFDAIVCSDAIYYVEEQGKRAALRWIAEHLAPDGFAFIAAYAPGGDYPKPSELRTLVERELVVEHEQLLPSGHSVLLTRRRRRLAALTLDYETWQPVPPGRRIDWERDVFSPTAALLDACDAEDARLTIFAELAEHAFLREHQPEIAARMEAQWRDAVARGHDVQIHLHPTWLPELGARLERDGYSWNELLTRADDHPNLVELIGRLKRTLEQLLRPVDPSYEAVAFRAGGYEAQPFRRLAQALQANGVLCDSSVYHGGRRRGMHHHYAHPQHPHQPWFASHADPQLAAPPAERGIVELPVTTFARNDRWLFDAEEGARFGARLLSHIEAARTGGASVEAGRAIAKARQLGGCAYRHARARRRRVNRLLPRALARALVEHPRARPVEDDFYVAVGHSKADLDVAAIQAQLRALREARVEVVRLADMARLAREQLERDLGEDAARQARNQVRRERAAVPASEGDDVQSHRLQGMIPLDRSRLLDLGCGAGTGSARIASAHPWMQVTGVDADEELVATASARDAAGNVRFLAGDFLSLPFADGAFDCVYASNSLEHAFDVEGTLAEARRVLAEGGVLLAAIPADAHEPARSLDEHTWKTNAHDVEERLLRAGFLDVEIEELDVYRLGAAPYPPANDRVLHVRAWRRARPLSQLERVDELRRWTHARLDPSRASESSDPCEIVSAGHAYCAGMSLVLGEALVREGLRPRWVTMIAYDHPRGRGARLVDSHEVIELTLADGSTHVLDPMADVRFPATLAALLASPQLADEVERERDEVYLARGYDLYATSFWYLRVVAVAVRERALGPQRFVPARWAAHATELPYQAAALARTRAWRALRRLSRR